MRKLFFLLISFITVFSFAQERTWDIRIINITKSQIFSPPIAVAHTGDSSLFRLGQAPSEGIYTMAEDGDVSVLMSELSGNEKIGDMSVSDGPVMPGQSVTIQLTTNREFNRVSVVGMLVITNDAFFAVDSAIVPAFFLKAGIQNPVNILALAYDAGSEANSEDCGTIPGPPCGSAGVRDTNGAEGYVHIHNGMFGIGDVDAANYSWDGPVALVEIRPAQ